MTTCMLCFVTAGWAEESFLRVVMAYALGRLWAASEEGAYHLHNVNKISIWWVIYCYADRRFSASCPAKKDFTAPLGLPPAL